MSETLPPIKDWTNFRKRIEYEDGLLNTRVNIFIVLNGLGAAILSLSKKAEPLIYISIIVILINLLLWLSTIQTAFIIRNLTSEYLKNAEDPIDMRVRKSIKWVPRRLRSTFILGVWLPLLLLLSWMLFLVFTVFN